MMMVTADVGCPRLVVCYISSVHCVVFRARWMACVPSVVLECGTVDTYQLSSVLETTLTAFVHRQSMETRHECRLTTNFFLQLCYIYTKWSTDKILC